MTDTRHTAADRPGADRGHRAGAEADRVGVRAVWHGDVPAPAVVPAVHLRGRRTRHELATRGTLWTWTIQCFRAQGAAVPRGGVEEFEPYGVGYIELPRRGPGRGTADRERSGAAADRHADGADARSPSPGRATRLTFAFPADGGRERVSAGERRGRRARHPPVRPPRRRVRASRWARSRPAARSRTRASPGRTIDFAAGGSDAAGNADTSVSMPRVDRSPVHQRQERLRDRRIGADDGTRDARLRRGRGRARRRIRQAPARRVQSAAGGLGDRLAGTARRA